MSSERPVKLGILSTANIAVTVLNALKLVPEAGVCTAVASRSPEKARKFADEQGIETACTYEELLQKPLDAIYIPLPTALATDWAVRCAEAGFHVLVDKPFASAESVQRIIDACEKKGVYFMDATHFVHSARTRRVREKIQEGAIGDVRRIVASFCIPIGLAGNIRADPELEPMGAAGDLGWYTMRSVIAYLGIEKAQEIKSVMCTGKIHPEFKVVESMEGVVVFGKESSQRVTLDFMIDSVCSFDQDVHIKGTTGRIDIPDFVVPYKQTDVFNNLRKSNDYTTDTVLVTTSTVSGFEADGNPVLKYPAKESETVKEDHGLTHPAMMVREFCRLIREKDSEKAHEWAAQSLLTQKLVDAAFTQIEQ